MTMFTYFSSIKSGKFQIRSNFWLNRKSCAFLSQSNPLWTVLSKPVGALDKLTWYWVDKNKNLQTHNHFLDTRDKLTDGRFDEMWFPKPHPVTGHYFIDRDEFITHDNFYQCVDDILTRDLITNPFNLFGYTCSLGSEKMMQQMMDQCPEVDPPRHVIDELRKRKSIIAYKEDIEHLAYNFFAGKGMQNDTTDYICEWINSTVKFQKFMPKFLDRYNIEYEMFSLDNGDYASTFELNDVLPRNSSDKCFTVDNPDAMKQVKYYMDKYYTP